MDSREASFKIICLNLKFQGRNFRHLRENFIHPCGPALSLQGSFLSLGWGNELTLFAKSIGSGGQSDIVEGNKQSKTDEKYGERA